MQKLMLGVAVAVLSASAGASDIDFSGSAGYASDYIWRGITKSDEKPIFSSIDIQPFFIGIGAEIASSKEAPFVERKDDLFIFKVALE